MFEDPSLMVDDDEVTMLLSDGIHAQVTQLDGSLEPLLFLAMLNENAQMSMVVMAMGSMTIGDSGCEIFEAVTNPHAESTSVSMVTAGKPGGVSAEHLEKLFSIPHDDAQWTLLVTTQLNCQSADSTLS
jgi:hypothetical protein